MSTYTGDSKTELIVVVFFVVVTALLVWLSR